MTDSELNEAIVIAMVKAPDERTRNRIAALAKDPELTKRALAGNAKSGTKAIVSPGRKAIETPMPAASAAGAPRPRPEMTGVDGSQMVPTAPHAVREMGKTAGIVERSWARSWGRPRLRARQRSMVRRESARSSGMGGAGEVEAGADWRGGQHPLRGRAASSRRRWVDASVSWG